jgi:hypothetical protein
VEHLQPIFAWRKINCFLYAASKTIPFATLGHTSKPIIGFLAAKTAKPPTPTDSEHRGSVFFDPRCLGVKLIDKPAHLIFATQTPDTGNYA